MDDFRSLPMLKEDLISSFKSGNRQAFGQLYDKYSPLLLGLIRFTAPNDKIANDILSDSFMQIWLHRLDYDAGKECIFTWMIRFTREAVSEAMRHHEKKNESDTEYDIQEKIFELMYVHGKSRQEVCQMLGTTDQLVTGKLKLAFGGLLIKKSA